MSTELVAIILCVAAAVFSITRFFSLLRIYKEHKYPGLREWLFVYLFVYVGAMTLLVLNTLQQLQE